MASYLDNAQETLRAASTTQEALKKFFQDTTALSAFTLKLIGTLMLEAHAKTQIDRGVEISLGGETIVDKNTNNLSPEHGQLIGKLIDAPVGTKVEGAENFDLKLYGQKMIQTDSEGIVTRNFWQSKEALINPAIQNQKNELKAMFAEITPEQETKSLSDKAKIEIPTGVRVEQALEDLDTFWDNEADIPDWAFDENIEYEADPNDFNLNFRDYNMTGEDRETIASHIAQEVAEIEGIKYFQEEEEEKYDEKAAFDQSQIEAVESRKRAEQREEEGEIEVEFYDQRNPIGENGSDSVKTTLLSLSQVPVVTALLKSITHAQANQIEQSVEQRSAALRLQADAVSIPKSGNLEQVNPDISQLQNTMQGIKNLTAIMLEPDAEELITDKYRVERKTNEGITEYVVFDRQDQNLEPVLAFADTGLTLSATQQTKEPDKQISLRVNVGQAQEAIKTNETMIAEWVPKEPDAIERYQTFTGMAGMMQEQDFATKRTTGLKGDGKLEISIEGNGSMFITQTVEGQPRNILEMDRDGNIAQMSMSSRDMKNANTLTPKTSERVQEKEDEHRIATSRGRKR
jgi:hypothetical protein